MLKTESRPHSAGSFYVTGGTLPLNAPSYVVRQADRDLLEGLGQGEFCYVLNTRQMGKSSLMIRAATELGAQGCRVAVLDLTAIGQNLTPAQWYAGLLSSLAEQLAMEDELEDFWLEETELGPMQRFFAAIGQVALPSVKGRLVIFIDEIDAVRSLPFPADEFFVGIRECYNRRTRDPEYEKLSFCLLGVATPADLIRDTRMSPFNIGRRIELTDFTPEEAAPLAKGLPGGSNTLARVLYWTSGHPYLTQRLCRVIAEDGKATTPREVDSLCEHLFLTRQARDMDDNLAFVRNRILRSEADLTSLLDLYRSVRNGKKVKDDGTDPLIPILRLSGVVAVRAGGYLRVRNRIYDRVFDDNWVLSQYPGAEVRRQREAYRRGVFRTALGAAIIIACMVFLTSQAIRQEIRAVASQEAAKQAQERAQADANQAELEMVDIDARRRQAEQEAAKAKADDARERALLAQALAELRELRREQGNRAKTPTL